ncbi:MAG: hypothetical protein GKR88_17065 [Flavobacteriaceae bacterium]|nr:MAG: hypothetical protein GKR88_17065 [Flavobacteriaceae bacterium]
MYYTYLLRTYRKLADTAIKKKKYIEALNHLNELFDKCSNYTNTDIKKYNKVVVHNNKTKDTEIQSKELIVVDEPDFILETEVLEFLREAKKPKGFKLKHSEGTSILDLKALSDFVPKSIAHIAFDKNGSSKFYGY